MLKELHLRDVGPAPKLDFEFASRLNVLTGDNGLGKTFVLDVVWYALTWTWAGEAAMPRMDAELESEEGGKYLTSNIFYVFGDGRTEQIGYHMAQQSWLPRIGTAGFSGAIRALESMFPGDGIILYARVDGSFAVWDAYRNPGRFTGVEEGHRAFLFRNDEIWNGLGPPERPLCNGLLRDWVSWQQTKHEAFAQLVEVLSSLSGEGGEQLEPGEPQSIRLDDAREFPTLKLPYGIVPIVHASAGMRRLCALAYMLVWAWKEHKRVAAIQRKPPVEQMTFLLDEAEAHLHPAWQRNILPALLRVLKKLAPEVKIQVFVSTHAPLVLASLEPHFQPDTDALFTFDITQGKNSRVVVEKAS
jgi:predicted ATPase